MCEVRDWPPGHRTSTRVQEHLRMWRRDDHAPPGTSRKRLDILVAIRALAVLRPCVSVEQEKEEKGIGVDTAHPLGKAITFEQFPEGVERRGYRAGAPTVSQHGCARGMSTTSHSTF